jgi:hypothetical protein
MGIVVDAENGMGWRVVVGIWMVWLLLVHGLVSNTAVGVRRRRLRRARFGLLLLDTLKSIIVQAGIYRKLVLPRSHAFRERRSFASAIHPWDGYTFTHRGGSLLAVESVHDEQRGR